MKRKLLHPNIQSHDMADSPQRGERDQGKVVDDSCMWKCRRTNHSRGSSPEGAGQNRQVGEERHNLQEHMLQAARSAPPDSCWGRPGAEFTFWPPAEVSGANFVGSNFPLGKF